MEVPYNVPACPYCGAKMRGPAEKILKKHKSDETVEYLQFWCSKCGSEGPLFKKVGETNIV